MSEKQGLKRFPKASFMRQLEYLMNTAEDYSRSFELRAKHLSSSPALQDLALSRSEILDQAYHDLNELYRQMAIWR